MRICVFCSGSPLTREHVYPQWLQQFQAPRSFIEQEGRYQRPFPQPVVRQDARGKFVEVEESRGNKTPNLQEVTVKSVCATCNNGWMSSLENSVRGPLTNMADQSNRERRIIDSHTKILLATWAHKCFSMYDQYKDSRDRVFVDDDFKSFTNVRRPPQTARIYMGITNSRYAQISLWHETQLLSLDPHADPQATLATQPRNLSSSLLAVQGVYFIEQYFKPDIPWRRRARRSIDQASRRVVEATPAHQIWPPKKIPLHWPPKLTSDQEFEDARTALVLKMNGLNKLAERVQTLD